MSAVLLQAGTLVLIIVIGYLARQFGWVKASDFGTLSAIAFRITLPCALVTSFDRYEMRMSLLWITLVGLVLVLTGQVVGWLALRTRGRAAQAFAIFHTPSCNIGLFAIPYLSSFVGPEAIIIAAMFDIGNSLAAGGIGYAWGTTLAKSDAQVRFWPIVKRIFSSPVFNTYLFILFLGVTQVKLPRPIIAFTTTVGAANTFVAMFMIGTGLHLLVGRETYVKAMKYLALRYAYMLMAALVVWFVLPIEPMEKVVVILILCAPMAVMASMFTEESGLDVRLSTLVSSVSVLVAIVAMPTVMLLLT